jgi:hypothetical protein
VTTSQPKRQHFVPRAYLERFASDGKVLVRRRDSKLFSSSPTNVAVECGFYDLVDRSGSKSSSVELMLADLESSAIEVIRGIDRDERPPPRDTPERRVLATFLAVQSTRTPEQRERVEFPSRLAKYANGREITPQVVAEFLERVHLRAKPAENETNAAHVYVTVALQDPKASSREFAIEMMMSSVGLLSPIISEMNWTVEFDRKDQLITSDTPLVIWRIPSHRDAYEGVGITNADELRFPLDPGKQLVMTRRERTPTARITTQRSRGCDADVASSCHHFIVGQPNQMSLIRQLRLTPHRPVLRFHQGPLLVPTSTGMRKTDDEVLHTWVQRRA